MVWLQGRSREMHLVSTTRDCPRHPRWPMGPLADRHQTVQMLHILWSLVFPSLIFLFPIMITNLYLNSYHILYIYLYTALQNRNYFFLIMLLFFVGICFIDLKRSRRYLYLNWHLKNELDPTTFHSSGPFLFVHLSTGSLLSLSCPLRVPQPCGGAWTSCPESSSRSWAWGFAIADTVRPGLHGFARCS